MPLEGASHTSTQPSSTVKCQTLTTYRKAPPPATANQDSWGGVAGQKVILRKHPQQLLAPVAGLRSTERLQEQCGATQNQQGKSASIWSGECSRALITFYLEAGPPAHLAGHRRSYPDAVPRPSVPVCPLLSCEPGGAHQHRSSFIALSAVRRCHRRLIRRIRTPEFAVLNE